MTDKAGHAAPGDDLRVVAAFEPDQEGRRPQDAAAYAFTNGGRLLGVAPLDDQGTAALQLPREKEPRGARIVVGPRLDEPDLGELLRRGAVERHIRLDPGRLSPVELTISPAAWLCWVLSRCTVRGTLLKRTERDGQTLDLPVCGATVEVHEVDPLPWIVARLPDDVLDRIREELLQPWPPLPEPDPPPFGGPTPVPGPGPGPFPPGPGPDPAPFTADAAGPHPARATAPASVAAAPAALRLAARSGSSAGLRQALLLHPELARPLICWLWPHVTTTRIGTAVTDDCGHFTATFFRGCRNPDQPDLYFRATQRHWIFDIPILAPTPITCHTHWDYKCGSEVTLYTTSPFARTCAPCPPIEADGNWVCVMHVGNLPVSNIRGIAQDLAPTTDAANRGQTSDGRPFGGMLRPHLEFDPDLRASGVRFYRVGVRRAGAGAFMPLDGEVHRHFIHDSGGMPVIEPYVLGPRYLPGKTEPFFEIPPDVPPQGVWTTADAVENITNAKFPSASFAPGAPSGDPDQSGKFELRIELFDEDGDPASGITWVVPKAKTLSAPVVIQTEAPAAGVVQGDAFVMTLHVDNNRCEASTGVPTLNGSSAADHCGVIRYTPPHASAGTVTMPYRAAHRNGFARHSFTVQRGVTPLTPPSVGSVPVGGGTFAPTATVHELMSPPGDPPCTIGAFLEAVHVRATATDGWGRLSGYDASAARAFTLAPQGP